MIYADTNICLRLILNDNQEMADFAENLFIKNDVFILHEVICEVVYVLDKVYNVARSEICKNVNVLLNIADVEDKDVIKQSLQNYEKTKLDFVDCILLAYNQINGSDVATFDKKLKNKLNS